MSQRIHRFGEPEPTTTGSTARPYRKNLRLDHQHGIRTDRLFSKDMKKLHGLKESAADCELWEVYLLGLEHANRYLVHGDSVMRELIAKLFKPLDPEDYLRAIYKRLQARFDPQMRLKI